MAINVGGIERGVIEAATVAIGAGVVTFLADAGVEFGRVPYLDEVQKSSPSEPTLSNYEKTMYGVGTLLFVLGVIDVATHHKLFGVGRWAIPASLGSIGGVAVYESWGAEALGIRAPSM
jgi:hypothetical protein